MTEEQINDEQRTETDLMQFVPKVHFEQIPIRNTSATSHSIM